MPRPVTITLKHDLGQDGARQRVKDGLGKLKEAISSGAPMVFSEEWVSEDRLAFSAKGLGQKATGTIDIFPEHVRIEMMLPAVLAALANTISGNVERQGRILLEKKPS